jgi:hypothetical protein
MRSENAVASSGAAWRKHWSMEYTNSKRTILNMIASHKNGESIFAT